jgi:hypothetical protein
MYYYIYCLTYNYLRWVRLRYIVKEEFFLKVSSFLFIPILYRSIKLLGLSLALHLRFKALIRL